MITRRILYDYSTKIIYIFKIQLQITPKSYTEDDSITLINHVSSVGLGCVGVRAARGAAGLMRCRFFCLLIHAEKDDHF